MSNSCALSQCDRDSWRNVHGESAKRTDFVYLPRLHCARPGRFFGRHIVSSGGSVAEWLACWTQAQKARVQIAAETLSGNSVRQSVHTHRASVHQAGKVVAALLRVAGVTAGWAESNGSLPPGLWLTSPAVWLPRTGISSRTLRSVIEYGLPLPFLLLVDGEWFVSYSS